MGDDGTPEQDEPELCDFCGTVITDQTELHTLVPDSSAVHASAPNFDGQRLLTSCTDDHMQRLVERYGARPFVDEELWAGKILRAVAGNPGKYIDDPFLAKETGLTVAQIHAAITWHNERARAVRERRGHA